MKTQFNLIHFLQCFFLIIVLAACNGGNAETDAGYDYYEEANYKSTAGSEEVPQEDYSEEEQYQEETTTNTKKKPELNQPEKNTAEKIQPMLIKNGQLNVEVDDAMKFRKTVDGKLEKYNAYISSENQDKNSYEISNTLVIRVPAANFDSLLAAFESEKGKITHKSVNVKDVTAEYLDIAGRLKTRKEVRARYQTLLGKANKVSEIIEIEEAARKVQEEIEAAEGRMKYLRSQSSFSTLTLYISQGLEYHNDGDGFWSRLANAFSDGWQAFLSFLIGLAHLWIFLIIGGITFYFIRKRFFAKK